MVHLQIEPPEIELKVVCECAECKDKILEGESIYKVGDKVFCENCVEHTVAEYEESEPDWDSMPGGYDY